MFFFSFVYLKKNLVTKEWAFISYIGDLIEPRKYHCSNLIGNYMITYGGENSRGNYLNDLWLLDLCNFF